MKQKDLNKIVKVEKAIAKKFGQEAIINPKSKWDDEKEQEYLQQLKEFYSRQRKKADNDEKINEEGFLLSKNLINRESKRVCTTCSEYSFNMKDDLYMNKFDCCWKCYIQWVEDREERWLSGWRPNNDKKE
jgi:hypothetical protein